jgi:6-pyruvoyltetrahydropterin/6-carboxytetrahydropterin synthase
LTTTPPGNNPESGLTGPFVCANCFIDFAWQPVMLEDEAFCCAGCAQGGPCICTYREEPVTAAPSVPPLTVTPEPPAQPEEERPVPITNGRRAVFMAAVAEMPEPVQQAVRMRVEDGASDPEIAEALGISENDVRRLLSQGQAILDRTLGPGFVIQHLPPEEEAEAPREEELPLPPSVEQPAEPSEGAPSPEFGELIARSVEGLTAAAALEGADQERARQLITEALRGAGDLFRLAAERIGAGETEGETPLREALAEAAGEELTLNVQRPGDPAGYFVALDSLEPVQWVRALFLSPEEARYRVRTSSFMAFVRGLLAMEGRFRPVRLQMAGDVISVELTEAAREQPAAGAPEQSVAAAAGEPSGPRFELSVDAFFGARHFIFSKGAQGMPHHHSYRVEAVVQAAEQDRDGFVLGFAEVREIVESTVMEFSETLLNTVEPFTEIQPTTENLARVFHQRISERLGEAGIRLRHVRVWESPTNSASYSDAAAAV